MLMHAQSAIYAALGCFVGTALVAAIGAILVSTAEQASMVVGAVALLVGTAGSVSLLYACALPVRETRLALAGLREDISPFGEPVPVP